VTILKAINYLASNYADSWVSSCVVFNVFPIAMCINAGISYLLTVMQAQWVNMIIHRYNVHVWPATHAWLCIVSLYSRIVCRPI